MNAKDMIASTLACLGASGLCNPELECGCHINDLAPCESCDLEKCVAAEYRADGRFYAMCSVCEPTYLFPGATELDTMVLTEPDYDELWGRFIKHKAIAEGRAGEAGGAGSA